MILLSPRAAAASTKVVKEPNLVICIEGAPYCIGSGVIKRIVRIGDPELYIDGSWLIGGVVDLDTQETLISLQNTSTSIKQQLDQDKGRGSSIQSLEIEFVDLNQKITELITPGLVLNDILGKKAKVYLSLDVGSAIWPGDYTIIFRGIIDDIRSGPATISLTISHPDQKKKQALFPAVEVNLAAAINSSQTTITLTETAGLLLTANDPLGNPDNSFRTYVRIEDEIIEYTGVSGFDLTGCVRGSLFTFAAAHNNGENVKTFYRLKGNAIDLALKLMLSNGGGAFVESIAVASINVLPDLTTEPNALYFADTDVVSEYGLTLGDYVTLSGATNPANNFTLRTITNIIRLDDQSTYIQVDGAALIDESPSTAVVEFTSRYNSLPQGLGLGADEVDVTQHELLRSQFLSSFELDFYIKDTIENVRDFMDQEIYRVASAYSVPRQARASVQMMVGPIPGSNLRTFNKDNIVNASKMKMRRSVNKNFYNTVIYRFDEDSLNDRFTRGVIEQSASSVAQIPVGTRALVVTSKGLRESENGGALATSAASRRLRRNEFGAELIENVETTLGSGFDVELGDVVIFDPEGLAIPNTVDGNRNKPAALFEVQNKSFNWKTGQVVLDLLDTAFDENARYGLIGISSNIRSVLDNTTFTIERTGNSPFGLAEFQKWNRYTNVSVIVRSVDSVTRYADTVLVSALSNTVTVYPALPFTPQPGDIMELAFYDDADTTAQIKLVYGHMSPLVMGADPSYVML